MKEYRGTFVAVPERTWVVMVHDGDAAGLLTHHVKHSPSGFSWGYGGSGPAELARCLLIDVLGDEAWCTTCGGTGSEDLVAIYDGAEAIDYLTEAEVTEFSVLLRQPDLRVEATERTRSCTTCMGEKTSFDPGLYQKFKFEFVGRWPQDGDWSMSENEIRTWIEQRR